MFVGTAPRSYGVELHPWTLARGRGPLWTKTHLINPIRVVRVIRGTSRTSSGVSPFWLPVVEAALETPVNESRAPFGLQPSCALFCLETPPLLGKDPALMLRAYTTAPVFNDEEKRARATTQVHKVARDGYRLGVGTLAFWAVRDSSTTLFARARHVGVLRLLFARELWLRRKWRDVMDQLRVVLVHAPDVSARTAIVRDGRVLARERQVFGGILPTRRTGRTRHVGTPRFPHGTCQLSHERFRATLRAFGASCNAEVVGRDPFRQPGDYTGSRPGNRGPTPLQGCRACKGLRPNPTRSEPAGMSTLRQTLFPASARRLVGATGFVPSVRIEHAPDSFIRVFYVVECVALGLLDYGRQDAPGAPGHDQFEEAPDGCRSTDCCAEDRADPSERCPALRRADADSQGKHDRSCQPCQARPDRAAQCFHVHERSSSFGYAMEFRNVGSQTRHDGVVARVMLPLGPADVPCQRVYRVNSSLQHSLPASPRNPLEVTRHDDRRLGASHKRTDRDRLRKHARL